MMEMSCAPAWRRTAPSWASGAAFSEIANRNPTHIASIAFFIIHSMSKMAKTGEDHRDVAFVGDGDDFGIADGAAWLNGGGGAGFGGGDEAVGERKKCIAANHTAFEGEAGFACFPD